MFQIRFLVGLLLSVVLPLTTLGQSVSTKGLRYGWKPDTEYRYKFNSKFGGVAEAESSQGEVTIRLEKRNVESDFSGESLIGEGDSTATSTAFSVNADGHLVTCEHCVRNAKQVLVRINGKDLPAVVLDRDPDLDLALLKVNAKDLPFVQLAKDRPVELAQDIRAVGFPLSEVLGSSVKVTRGSVSGFVDSDEQQSYQIDAAINPGNSGGPLVDDSGAVIGVVNAKLSGYEISKVGFSVPIKHACELLDKNKVTYSLAENEKVLTGPALAKQITPAVFFVKSDLAPDVSKNFLLSANGNIVKQRSRSTINGEALVSSRGVNIDSRKTTNLGMFIGAVCAMTVEALPERGAKKWVSSDPVILPLPKTAPRQSLIPGIRGPIGIMPHHPLHRRGPFGMQPEQEVESRMALGIQETNYEVKSQTDQDITIGYERTLKTVGDEDEYSSLNYSLSGELVFNREKGVFVSKSIQGSVNLKMGAKTVVVPIEFSYELVGDRGVKEIVVVAEPPKDDQQRIAELLAGEVGEMEQRDVILALKAVVDARGNLESKEKVLTFLLELTESGPSEYSESAIDGILSIDTSLAFPYLVKGLEGSHRFSQRKWIFRLANVRTEESAEILLGYLADPRIRRTVVIALQSIGAVAEGPVVSKLENPNTQSEEVLACLEVLRKIGTQRGLDALENAWFRDKDWVVGPLSETLSEMENRK